MENQRELLLPVTSVSPLLIPAVLLLLPIVLTLCFRWTALHTQKAEQKRVWAAYRRFGRFILAGTVVGWWVDMGLIVDGRSALISTIVSRWPKASSAETLPQRRGELEQIQFLLGYVLVQTTEKYLGSKRRLREAVNDKIGIEPVFK